MSATVTAPTAQTPEQTSDLASEQVCKLAGISPRQLNYWASKGWLRPLPRKREGIGFPMRWTPQEAEIARRMGFLVETGGIPPEKAALYVRQTPEIADELLRIVEQITAAELLAG